MMGIVFKVNRPQNTSQHFYILGHVHLSASASIALILLPRGFLRKQRERERRHLGTGAKAAMPQGQRTFVDLVTTDPLLPLI